MRSNLRRAGQSRAARGRSPSIRSGKPIGRRMARHPEELASAIGPNTTALLMMSPAMPTGAVMSEAHSASDRHGTGGP